MSSYSVFLPSYSVGENCYNEIPYVTRHYGNKAVVIGRKTAMMKAKEDLLKGIKQSDIQILDFVWFGGDSSYENIDMLKKNTAVQEAEILFGVGGGRACDTVKVLGHQLHKPVFTFPTLASNCVSCTAISVIYNADGSFNEYYYLEEPATHTFINTKVIANSPKNYYGLVLEMHYLKNVKFYLHVVIKICIIRH
jgi:glycerol dehydrogenase